MSEFTDKLDIAISHVKAIDMGAEAFPPELYNKLKAVSPDILIMNGYGPTEATVSCTMQVIDNPDDITIGIPNGNVNVVTMDKDGNVLPLGEIGELVIIGDGVGRGYIGRDDLTKEKFITVDGKKAYKSGDLARIREDGNIEFRGRIDNQVKLRGLRVELGEIESNINSFPGVNTSIVVVVKQDTEYLAAYFTASEEIEVEALKEHLSSKLTEYMVPQVFIQLDKMPLTANGKIDKKKLPSPTMQEVVIEPAHNQTQQDILDIAIEVIGNDRIGVTTDLFTAGMSSISGMKFCAILSAKYNKDIRIADIADNSTVVDIEKLLDDSEELINYEFRDEYPLSMNQMGIYIESELHQGTTIYNIPSLYKLDDRVDLDKLRKAIVKVASSHPYLFMILEKAGDRVVVKRRDNYELEVPCTTCDKVPSEEELVKPFDLTSNEVLVRAELFDTKDGKYFFLDTHHIVSDGASIDILVEDINKIYMGEEVVGETYTGFEYALDEERLRSSDKYNKAKEWYDSIFAGCSGETMPVTDGNDSEQLGILKDQLNVKADDIRAFCKKNNFTVNAFFTAAFGMAVKSFSAAEETIFSTIYNGRSDARLENSVSMLVKTFPVYFNPKNDSSIVSVIRDTQSYLLNAMSNDIYSFAEVKNEYGINGDMIFAYQGDIDDIAIIGGYESNYKLLNLSRSRMPIGIDVFLSGDMVLYESEYVPSLYSEYTIQGIINLLDVVSQEFVSKEKLSDISLVSDNDIEAIKNVHDTIVNVPAKPAYRLMQDSAEKFPERTAVAACDRKLTYKEFNEEASKVGHSLISRGVKPDTIVAVLADRNSYAYVMRQGVLKSGGAFLPIDPEYPEDRIRFILEDSKAMLILTTSDILTRRKGLFDALGSEGIEVVAVEDALQNKDSSNPNVDVPYDALAYVIYTSGSTGKPKGVMLTNHNLVNFVYDDEKNAEIHGMVNGCSAVLAIAALTFDFAIMEEFVPLANGMSAVLATNDDIMNPLQLADVMTKNKVDCMCATPSYLINLLDMGEYTDKLNKAISNVKAIDMGAEAFPPVLYTKLKAVSPDILIMNGYGPTEATVSCTMQVIDNPDDITIGIPNGNVNVATMDREGRLQPLGAMGEMIIIGDGIGRGYIGRDDLNKKNFISLFGRNAYRSGDLVRIREDGNIEFHGRIDNQVKLRGLRVELGEIESNINSYPGIGTSIVIVVKQDTEYLAAYYTADEKIDTESLKEHLSSKLTEYMVPQVLIQLDKMPLTANGKIDKKKLPKPSMEQEEIVPPENETQQKILDIIASVLGKDSIGIKTDLFSAGLSSIGCIKLCSLLSNEFDKDIRISDVFDNRTIVEIEALLEETVDEIDLELRDEYPLTMTQMGIFVESMRFIGTTVYNIPFLYKLSDDIDMSRLQDAISTAFMAHPYIYMTIKNVDDDAVALRNEVHPIDVKIGDVLPSVEEIIQPFDLLSGEELYRVSLYDTSDGKYLFIDLHHIIADGESFDILLEDINSAYEGEEVITEEFSGYEVGLTEQAFRASSRFNKAKSFYDGIFNGVSPVILPDEEKNPDTSREDYSSVISKVAAKNVKDYCDEKELSLNAFFTAAFGMALKTYTGADKALFATIYNGRSDSRTSRSVTMLVKTLPVLLEAHKNDAVVKYITECQNYLINAMANDIVSFSELSSSYGLDSDILFAYQGEGDDDVVLGGRKATEVSVDLDQEKSPFGLDISIQDDNVIYDFECDGSKYGTFTIDRFSELLDAIVDGFISKSSMAEVMNIEAVKKLTKESVKTSSAKEEKAGKASHVSGEANKAYVDTFVEIMKKVLGVSSVSPDDNFFEIGGTSLSAAKVMMAAMSQDLPVLYKDIFDHPTPRELAILVDEKNEIQFGAVTDASISDTTDEPKTQVESEKVLSHNTIEYVDEITREDIGNVLLVGASGFLGIHILDELLENGDNKIYCLMHNNGKSSMERLKQIYFYYFDKAYDDEWDNRIEVLEVDISNPDSLDVVKEYDFSTVINCAAIVKHFGDVNVLKKVNTDGVINLAQLCLATNSRLIHVSTVSVGGDSIGEDADRVTLYESNLDIGQEVESNAYVYTKYLAEKYLVEAMEKEGLDAKIMRVGNLMSRFSDGESQVNFHTNNFMNALGCFPVQDLDEVDEFSPIDEVAKAIVTLSGTGKEFNVFHVYNSHSVEMGDIIYALKDMGYNIDIVDESEFNDRLREMISDENMNQYVSPLINYNMDDDDIRAENDSDNSFTVKALYRLGFKWSLTSTDYIETTMDMLSTFGFFEANPD